MLGRFVGVRIPPPLVSGPLFALLAAVLFREVLFQGKTLIATDFLAASPVWRENPEPALRNRWLSDTIEYYYPVERFSSEHARRGEIPVDNPHLFNGVPVPHGAHVWNSVWPLKVLFQLLFDPVRSYDLYAIFHFWLAGVAMHALLLSMGMSGFAAVAGSLVYVLSGRSMLWLHGHYMMPTVAYAPLVFLALLRAPAWAAFPVAGLFFSNPQVAVAVSAAACFFAPGAWKPVLAGGLTAGVALVPLAAAVLGGTRDPIGDAQAFYQGFKTWLLPVELVAPGTCWAWGGGMPPNEYNVYLGLVPLAGALAAARRERWWAALGGIVFVAATFWPLPVLLAPFSFSLPTRFLFLFTLAGCVCFARAMTLWPRGAWARAAVLVLVLVDLAPRFARWNAPYDPAILRERPPAVEAMRGGRVGWMLQDHPVLGRPVTPPLWLFDIPSVQGYHMMVPRAQVRALQGAGEVQGQRLIVLKDPGHPALEALGMRWLVTDAPLPPSEKFRLVHRGSVHVYENPRAPDVPPRSHSRLPLRIGLGVTLAGLVLLAVLGLLDRPRNEGYS